MNTYLYNLLPKFIRHKLDGRHGLQAILINSGWLLADKILRMGSGLIVGVWTARYLGPDQFGLLNYAIAFTALFGALAALGLDGILIRTLIKYPEDTDKLLGSAFVLKLVGGCMALLISIVSIIVLRPGNALVQWIVMLSAAGFIFQAFNVIDFYFQAKIKSKYIVFASNSAYLSATAIRVILLFNEAPLISFAWVLLLEITLTAFFLLMAFRFKSGPVEKWKFDKITAIDLLSQSWPLILSGITVMLYMRLDQVMIGQILGDKEVGLFSAAVRLSEVWYFIPFSIVSSVFPAILNAKKQGEEIYLSRIQQLYDVMTWLGISVAVITSIMAPFVVNILYGSAYLESATVLSIQIWAGVWVCISYAHAKWLLVEGLQKYSLIYTSIGAILNIICNLLFIPIYGIKGLLLQHCWLK